MANATAYCTADAPRQEVDSFGEPVASEQVGKVYYEAYSSGDRDSVIFVAKYRWADEEWVKLGLDRHRVSALFNTDGWPSE